MTDQLHSALYRGSALVSSHQAQQPEMLLTQLLTMNKSRSNIINRKAARGITVQRERLFRQTQQISPRKPKASIVTVDPYRSCQLSPTGMGKHRYVFVFIDANLLRPPLFPFPTNTAPTLTVSTTVAIL